MKKVIHDIYSKLQDDQSKEIFSYRLLYSLTEDVRYIDDMIKCNFITKVLNDFITSSKSTNIALFGAGYWGGAIYKKVKNLLNEPRNVVFIDNDKTKKEFFGVPIVAPSELLAFYPETAIIITSTIYFDEIKKQLSAMGVGENNVCNIGGLIGGQYFDLDALWHSESEVFIDVGMFNGKTSILFNKWCNGRYKHIFGFEPDLEIREKLDNNIRVLKDLTVYPVGLGDKRKRVGFVHLPTGSSRIKENVIGDDSKSYVELDTLDSILPKDTIPTFIKMDIEGAELKAIDGARKQIEKNKPKLAISIYHKPEDIWEIPLKILEINDSYTFYLRHYSFEANETVLYGI